MLTKRSLHGTSTDLKKLARHQYSTLCISIYRLPAHINILLTTDLGFWLVWYLGDVFQKPICVARLLLLGPYCCTSVHSYQMTELTHENPKQCLPVNIYRKVYYGIFLSVFNESLHQDFFTS